MGVFGTSVPLVTTGPCTGTGREARRLFADIASAYSSDYGLTGSLNGLRDHLPDHPTMGIKQKLQAWQIQQRMKKARGLSAATASDEEIVWVASYPRSGNTWVRFLFGAYAHGIVSDWSICNYAITDIHWWIFEARRQGYDEAETLRRIAERFEKLPVSAYRSAYLVSKTHFKWSPRHPFLDRTSKVIHLVRHPKDVLLSSLNYHKLVKNTTLPSEPEAARGFIKSGGDPQWLKLKYGTWFEHYESWSLTGLYPRLLVRYEDLKRDTLGEFIRMIEFLGLPVDEERARLAVEQTSLKEMRRLEAEAREKKHFFDAQEGHYFTHKGATGQSLSHLGDDLDALFDERFAPWLEATGYSDVAPSFKRRVKGSLAKFLPRSRRRFTSAALTKTPTEYYDSRQDGSMRPSWDRYETYINDEHEAIFEQTKDLPGWQAPGDSYKLYEMGHYAGEVILEIGTYGGRSATVELRGALSKTDRAVLPQFFGIDHAPPAIQRTYNTLKQEDLADYALLYCGTLQEFAQYFDIRPTMVFVDADHSYEGMKKDLDTLSAFLEPGVPVLCHNYTNPKSGSKRAVTEWEEAGYAEFMGVFGISVLLVTTEKCTGTGKRWTPEAFYRRRKNLLKDYGILSEGILSK